MIFHSAAKNSNASSQNTGHHIQRYAAVMKQSTAQDSPAPHS